MAELVSRKLDNVETSGFEFSLPRPSYTIDTLNALQEKFPDDEFVLVIGADNWVAFNRWARYQEILDKYQVLVYPREGYKVEIPEDLHGKVNLVEAPIVEVSSTAIREGVKEGKNMSFYMPDDVYRYVLQQKLYQ